MKLEIKKILEIAIPSTIAWGGHIFYNIVDNMMIAKMLGTEDLAISGIASSVYLIFLLLGMGSSSILTALIAQASAEKAKYKTQKVFQNGLFVCTLIGVSLFLFLFFGGGAMIGILSKQSDLNGNILPYLQTLSFAAMPVMVFFAFERLCEGLNRARIAMYTVLLCNLLNGFFNYGFLGGNLGMPNLGIQGAALTTVLTNFFEVIIIVILAKRDKILKHVIRFKLKYFSKKEMWKITSLGLPGGMLLFLEGTAFNLASLIASKSSINDVAAHQVLLWTINGFLTPIFGLSTAITARIAYNLQTGKKNIAFKLGVGGFGIAGTYMAVVMMILFIFKVQIFNFMLKGDANDLITINLIFGTLFIMIFVETFDSMQLMGVAILRGYRDTKIPALFALISYWGLCIPLAYLFSVVQKMGVYGIWLGIGCGVFVQASLCLHRFYSKYKTKH
jgi:MATE family multidrug resistance protein